MPRSGSRNGDGLVAYRMVKLESEGMQGDAAVGVGTGGIIFEVAFDGTPQVGQLATDLMVATGVELYFEQIVASSGYGL